MSELTLRQRRALVRRAVRHAERGACHLADAGRLLQLAGLTQASRSMHTASHDAAQAVGQAEHDVEKDHDR